MKKLLVLFPGIGYTCDKPLLHYAGKLFKGAEYEILKVSYGSFPTGEGGEDTMRIKAEHAVQKSIEALSSAELEGFDRVVFIGKSIGTIACTHARNALCKDAVCLLLTPLEATFSGGGGACAFHGTGDKWAKTENISTLCQKTGTKLYTYKGADHSLETGDVKHDITQLLEVIKVLEHYI